VRTLLCKCTQSFVFNKLCIQSTSHSLRYRASAGPSAATLRSGLDLRFGEIHRHATIHGKGDSLITVRDRFSLDGEILTASCNYSRAIDSFRAIISISQSFALPPFCHLSVFVPLSRVRSISLFVRAGFRLHDSGHEFYIPCRVTERHGNLIFTRKPMDER